MTSQTWALSLAELVYYLIIVIPILFLLIRFRGDRKALLGWIGMSAYALLQIVSSAIVVSDGQNGAPSMTAAIIQSVGLSPFLWGTMGFLLQSVQLTPAISSGLLSTRIISLWHTAIIVGIAIGAYGATEVYSTAPKANSESLFRAGFSIIVVCWVYLLACTIYALRSFPSIAAYRPMLLGCVVANLALALRVGYVIFCISDVRSSYGFTTSSIAIRVVFSFIPGILITSAFVAAGFACLVELGKVVNSGDAEMGHK